MDNYNHDEPQRSWRKLLVWGLVLLGGPLLLLIGVGAYAAYVGSPEEQFDRIIARNASDKPIFDAMKKHYPDEYAAFRRNLTPLIERAAPPEATRLAVSQFLRGFNDRHRWEVGRAPDAQLKAYMVAQLAAYEKISARSPQACGAIAHGRLLPPGPGSEADSAVLAPVGVRYIEAAAAGRDNAANRPPPSSSDRNMVGEKLLALGLRSDVRALMARSAPTYSFSDDQMCHATLMVMRSLAKLPEDVALRVQAEIVQTS